MQVKRIHCPKCRRLFDSSLEFCPNCGAPNLLSHVKPLDSEQSKTLQQDASISDVQPTPVAKPVPVNKPKVQAVDPHVFDEIFEEEDNQSTADEQDVDILEGQEEVSDEPEAFSLDTEENPEPEDNDDDIPSGESDIKNMKFRRKLIDWADDKEQPEVDVCKIYNKDGSYNPNYDGYYDDTKTKIDNEIDSLIAGNEKTILKIIAIIVGIFGVIVYLILTL